MGSRNVKTYLSLQNYLLQKHLHRLNEFQSEIYSRVSTIFNCTTQCEADKQFVQILADMSKMKTRCKHILDVTDRYCVLSEEIEIQNTSAAGNNLAASPTHSNEDSLDSSHSTGSS